MYVVSLITSCI